MDLVAFEYHYPLARVNGRLAVRQTVVFLDRHETFFCLRARHRCRE